MKLAIERRSRRVIFIRVDKTMHAEIVLCAFSISKIKFKYFIIGNLFSSKFRKETIEHRCDIVTAYLAKILTFRIATLE